MGGGRRRRPEPVDTRHQPLRPGGARESFEDLTALPHSEADHWTPFAPHGWTAIGTAASLLMFAFFGWEAGSHLAGELRDPGRQLPRAMASAFAVVAVLYLGLATASIGVGASSDVPLADLMASGLGETGRRVTAVLAVLLAAGLVLA